MKESLARVLTEWQETWTPELIERDFDFSLIPEKPRKVVTFAGCRRTGKTYLMFQLINELSKKVPKERIFYINFEDERLEKNISTLTGLIPTIEELFGTSAELYLFLDEIQNVEGWDSWVRRVHDSGKAKLFLSGSSSKLSSREIPTSLRGRALTFEVFPLSFREFLRFKGFEVPSRVEFSSKKPRLLNLLREYVTYGGFPEVVLADDPRVKRLIVTDYFNTIIALDVVERYSLRNPEELRAFLRLALNSEYLSLSKMERTLKSLGYRISRLTLANYLRYLSESYFLFPVEVLSPKVRLRIGHPKKVYFVDNSFLTFLSVKFSENFGRLMENTVFLELRRKGEEINYLLNENWEIDFALPEKETLIQVSYDLSDPETLGRELKAVKAARRETGWKKAYVINWDIEKEVDGIKLIPLWRFLLEEDY
ncbi:predicted ATPase, AAA superfamily [Thermococcus kodakarensis KOD1]|uniref:Predicted ATPase, AAA superfamily n=1 Tax=Thermococcus kodakarensis (strain ATCC BAA-918 / JCM 12380 / KOD1) TaxID=69014 RepID=Q5JDV7_THEKO|nr:ATP-binding protein [Thermococcus kodakarensis]WCN27731.1 ATP-binding protein [Thermococcus kodakarensis]WCN30024.1 ATP-binding protein [Thermococcus kodakarensis]BAD86011.1 predicted ATPase, AAA superfamily [Thermococcus kodakarensis KOD1]